MIDAENIDVRPRCEIAVDNRAQKNALLLIISSIFGKIVTIITIVYFVVCRGEIIGVNQLPKGPFILAANHVSYLDWIILHTIFKCGYRRHVKFVAKKRLFKSFFWEMLMLYGEAVYLDQEKPSKSLYQILKQVASCPDNVIGIFPEGRRSDKGEILPGQIGVVRFASFLKLPIVPVGLNGFYELLPKGKKTPRVAKCKIVVGEPIFLQENNEEEDLRRIMTSIASLSEQQYIY